jgi:hypothetical protein
MHANFQSPRPGRPVVVLSMLLCLGAIPAASAQPFVPDDAAHQIKQMERDVADPSVRDRLTIQQWETYARQLSGALASGHEGLQQGALRMIIQYGNYLPFERPAVFDVVRLYRDHENPRMRRMAVVALGQMHDAWAIDFLERSARFEKELSVRHTIVSVLAAHEAALLGPARRGN